MTDKNTPKENTKTNYLYKSLKYFLEHPAIAGSVIYIAFSFLGVIYSWLLYRKFQINIFDYAEANDFLLIAFKEPVTFSTTLIAVLLLVVLTAIFSDQVNFLVYMAISWWQDITIYRRCLNVFFLSGCLFFTLIMLLGNYVYTAARIAEHIKHEDSTIITVLYEEGKPGLKPGLKPVVKELESSLIGSTEKFMFFYDRSDKHTIVIPITKIISITSDNDKIVSLSLFEKVIYKVMYFIPDTFYKLQNYLYKLIH